MTIKRAKKKPSATMRFLNDLVGPLTLGGLLEATRKGEELTLARFAKKLRISVSHLNDIEKGRKAVSPERAARFARVLGYSETQYVRLALQDLVHQAGLNYTVDVRAA